VADIDTFEKNPDRRVHRHSGIRKIVNPEDKTSGAFEVSKSQDEIMTIHHRRTHGGDQRIRQISRKENSSIGKSVNRRSGIQEDKEPEKPVVL
jgi:hypothetical protein